MADILSDNQDPLQNNSASSNNPVSTLPTSSPTPVSSPTVSPSTPIQTPAVAEGVNTGEQYEVNELHPEDLDVRITRWKCLVCNYIYEGFKPIKKCPRCGNEDPDKFEDID